MSWDIVIINVSGEVPATVDEISEDGCSPLGSADEVRRQVSAQLPDIDWSDPVWGEYLGDGFTIEFNIGGEDPVITIGLHVRGGGDPVTDIMRLTRAMKWQAIDLSTGEFINPDDPSTIGWTAFQSYRDKIIQTNQDKSKE
jgi:hypothetical protein